MCCSIIVVPAVPVPMPAHPAQTVIGPDDPAAVIIIGVVVRVIAAMEEATVMVEVRDAEAAVVEVVEAAEVRAMPTASAVPSSATVPTATSDMAATEMAASAKMTAASAAMPTAADLDHQVIRC